MKKFAACLFFTALFLTVALNAQTLQAAPEAPQPVITSPDQLDLIDVSVVTKILKPDLIRLQNKKTYRLDEIRVPPLYSQVAMAYLAKTLIGKKVGVYADKYNKMALNDSYGNGIGSIVLEDATWVQADMVSRGIAWAYSTTNNRLLVRELQKLEGQARKDNLGFWANPEYSIKTRENVEKYLNSFQVFQGKVTFIETVDDRNLFYFGTDSKRGVGLVASMSVSDLVNFEKRFDPSKWANRILRIRGWIESDPASPVPIIKLTHLQQVEVVDAAKPAGNQQPLSPMDAQSVPAPQ